MPDIDESAALQVTELRDEETDAWDAFVQSNDRSTFFHLAGWREVISASCGFRPYYLYAHRDGVVQGVLPLFHVRSILFGNTLKSTPFCVVGGPVGSAAAVDALIDAALALADRLGVDGLELRNHEASLDDWSANDLYVTFSRDIDPDPEKNMKAIPRKQRAMVRKGIKAGLESEVETSLENFLSIYSASVRNLGTPVFPKAYFRKLREVFASSCEVTTVYKDGEPVSSVLSFLFGDTILPYYGGGLPKARTLAAYDFLYWEVMRRACENGLRRFDFGRSKQGAGSYSFKKNWGFEPQPLHYRYLPIKSDSIPDRNPMSPKYRTAVALWKKLPMPIANTMGPLISPYLA